MNKWNEKNEKVDLSSVEELLDNLVDVRENINGANRNWNLTLKIPLLKLEKEVFI